VYARVWTLVNLSIYRLLASVCSVENGNMRLLSEIS
jgi:hypothetical protein